jgi:hypothetical protein
MLLVKAREAEQRRSRTEAELRRSLREAERLRSDARHRLVVSRHARALGRLPRRYRGSKARRLSIFPESRKAIGCGLNKTGRALPPARVF